MTAPTATTVVRRMQDLTVELLLNGKDRGTLSVKDALQHISAERESIKW